MGKMWDGPFRLWQVRCILTEPERFFAYILIIIYSDGLAHFGPERYQFCAPEDVHNSISQKRWDGPVWFLGAQISNGLFPLPLFYLLVKQVMLAVQLMIVFGNEGYDCCGRHM